MRPDANPERLLPHLEHQRIFVFPRARTRAITANQAMAASQQGRSEGGRP